MRVVIIFDADNTLWDTDSVFRAAQLAMLNVFAQAGLVKSPPTELRTLRALDEEFIRLTGRAEYDFRILAIALAQHYVRQLSLAEAAQCALTYQPEMAIPVLAPIVDAAHRALAEGLRAIPPLFPDAEGVLKAIRAASSPDRPIVTALFTEGSSERLQRILMAHRLVERVLFDTIMIAPKSVTAWREAYKRGAVLLPSQVGQERTLGIVVGDSLRRDIVFGNQAGMITVYKPSTYQGLEIPQTPDEKPFAVISTLADLPAVLCRLDVEVPPLAKLSG